MKFIVQCHVVTCNVTVQQTSTHSKYSCMRCHRGLSIRPHTITPCSAGQHALAEDSRLYHVQDCSGDVQGSYTEKTYVLGQLNNIPYANANQYAQFKQP